MDSEVAGCKKLNVVACGDGELTSGAAETIMSVHFLDKLMLPPGITEAETMIPRAS